VTWQIPDGQQSCTLLVRLAQPLLLLNQHCHSLIAVDRSSSQATDELGFEAVTGRVHMHDLHATTLHLLGLDHEQLTSVIQGAIFV